MLCLASFFFDDLSLYANEFFLDFMQLYDYFVQRLAEKCSFRHKNDVCSCINELKKINTGNFYWYNNLFLYHPGRGNIGVVWKLFLEMVLFFVQIKTIFENWFLKFVFKTLPNGLNVRRSSNAALVSRNLLRLSDFKLDFGKNGRDHSHFIFNFFLF